MDWRGMPDELYGQIAADVAAAGTDPELIKRLRDVGAVVRTGPTADFIAAIEDQKAKVRALARPRTPDHGETIATRARIALVQLGFAFQEIQDTVKRH